MQFSIRTLLVTIGLSCVGLGVWVVPREQQRRAAAAIEELGGDVGFLGKSPLRSWLLQSYFDEIVSVNFLDNTQVTDDGLAHLENLTALQEVWLDNTRITDAALAHFEGLSALQRLYLRGAHISDAGLAHLQDLTGLEELWLDNTQVTDAGLAYLEGLTALQWLELTNTEVTDDGLAKLRNAMPKCQVYGP
jgi:Leucine-rich repeat (LRR) protein